MSAIIGRINKYGFLFEELAKRDFKKKYKRTFFGILWSMIAPLLQLLVMALIFTRFFGETFEYFVIYLFAGTLVFTYFSEATTGGMEALTSNAGIITKIKAPKYLFLLSKNVSSLINFLLTLVIFFVFVAAEQIPFHPRFILLIYPVFCLLLFNIGMGLILSALYVFFRDVQYLYGIFTQLLMYLSAIFYPLDVFPQFVQKIFLFNPVFAYIHYFRLIIIHGLVPSLNVHLLCGFYAIAAIAAGSLIYKKFNYRFIYYM